MKGLPSKLDSRSYYTAAYGFSDYMCSSVASEQSAFFCEVIDKPPVALQGDKGQQYNKQLDMQGHVQQS